MFHGNRQVPLSLQFVKKKIIFFCPSELSVGRSCFRPTEFLRRTKIFFFLWHLMTSYTPYLSSREAIMFHGNRKVQLSLQFVKKNNFFLPVGAFGREKLLSPD